MNGIAYGAERVFGRLGAVIRCYMLNPEDGEAVSVPEERRKKMKLLHKMAGPGILVVLVLIFWASRQFSLASLLVALGSVATWIAYLAVYKNLR